MLGEAERSGGVDKVFPPALSEIGWGRVTDEGGGGCVAVRCKTTTLDDRVKTGNRLPQGRREVKKCSREPPF